MWGTETITAPVGRKDRSYWSVGCPTCTIYKRRTDGRPVPNCNQYRMPSKVLMGGERAESLRGLDNLEFDVE